MLQQLEQVQWFPYTKFYPPLVGGDVLERPGLLRGCTRR